MYFFCFINCPCSIKQNGDDSIVWQYTRDCLPNFTGGNCEIVEYFIDWLTCWSAVFKQTRLKLWSTEQTGRSLNNLKHKYFDDFYQLLQSSDHWSLHFSFCSDKLSSANDHLSALHLQHGTRCFLLLSTAAHYIFKSRLKTHMSNAPVASLPVLLATLNYGTLHMFDYCYFILLLFYYPQ